MVAGQSIKRGMALGLIAIGLVVTHWLAYRLGVQNEHQRIATAGEQLLHDSEAQAFEIHLQYLRLLSRHPNDLPLDDRLTMCRRTKVLADAVERSRVALNRKLGNDPEADRWQQKVADARSLIAKLSPEKQ